MQVIATAATDDIARVRELGANTAINFKTQKFEEEVRNVDAVIDLVGGEVQKRSFQVLRRGGKLISAVSPPDQHLAQSLGIEAEFFLVRVTSERLAEIAGLIDGGKLKTQLGAVLPLADAREAHRMLESSQPRPKGKIVLSTAARQEI
jgi:NADPH:quinone reductase-like Zn-dependent oxidoreductase